MKYDEDTLTLAKLRCHPDIIGTKTELAVCLAYAIKVMANIEHLTIVTGDEK